MNIGSVDDMPKSHEIEPKLSKRNHDMNVMVMHAIIMHMHSYAHV